MKSEICSNCKNKAIDNVEYAGKYYCNRHFLELMEKRIRKHIRVKINLDVNKTYTILNDDSSEFHLTKYFLEKIFDGRLALKEIKTKLKDTTNKIIPTNLDEQAIIFLDEFLKNKNINNKTNNNKSKEKDANQFIAPLEVILQKEVELLCKILKIKFVNYWT